VLLDFDFDFDSVLLGLAFGVGLYSISYLLFHCILFSMHSINQMVATTSRGAAVSGECLRGERRAVVGTNYTTKVVNYSS